jgi:hypothetical protein
MLIQSDKSADLIKNTTSDSVYHEIVDLYFHQSDFSK